MPTELKTGRLRLGAWRETDLDAYQRLVRERDTRTAAVPGDGRPTRDELSALIRRHQSSLADIGIGLLAIRIRDRFAGYCGLVVVGRATLREPELAYELLRDYQGNGYATEGSLLIRSPR